MNIKQIRYFIAVAELGSLSSAAKSQGVTVQAVSKAVADLEREVGHDLFVRESRGVRPTTFGHAFYQKALPISNSFSELETFAAEYQETQQQLSGKLRLALASPPFYRNEIARANIAAFIKKSLGFETTVDLGFGEEGISALREGTFDALISIDALSRPDLDCISLGTIPASVIMRENHPLAANDAITIEELKEYPIGISSMFNTFNDALMITYGDCGLNLQFREQTSQERSERFFNEENGVSFGAGISALTPLFPGTVMCFMCAKDAASIPICLITLKAQKSRTYLILEQWLSSGSSIVDAFGMRDGGTRSR